MILKFQVYGTNEKMSGALSLDQSWIKSKSIGAEDKNVKLTEIQKIKHIDSLKYSKINFPFAPKKNFYTRISKKWLRYN